MNAPLDPNPVRNQELFPQIILVDSAATASTLPVTQRRRPTNHRGFLRRSHNALGIRRESVEPQALADSGNGVGNTVDSVKFPARHARFKLFEHSLDICSYKLDKLGTQGMIVTYRSQEELSIEVGGALNVILFSARRELAYTLILRHRKSAGLQELL